MDQLTAYRVLGLNSDATTEEVKEAYARLSKENHPEENPEEFQQIHEAYTTLTRRGRRANRAMVLETSPIKKNSTPEPKESDLIFRNIQKTEEDEVEEEQTPELSFQRSMKNARKQQEEINEQVQTSYDFESSILQAQKGEEEQFAQDVQMCIKELETLFSLPNCNEVKKFKEFFGRKEYNKVFYTPAFIHALAEYIKQIDLRYGVYSYLIKFYQLKDKKRNNLIPEAQRLYTAINNRYSIKNDVVGSIKSSLVLGGLGGLVYPVVKWGPKIFRRFLNNEIEFDPSILMILVPVVIIYLACVFSYKFFAKEIMCMTP